MSLVPSGRRGAGTWYSHVSALVHGHGGKTSAAGLLLISYVFLTILEKKKPHSESNFSYEMTFLPGFLHALGKKVIK